MATENRTANTSLANFLLDEPYRFDFFQAVRLLERLYPFRQSIGYDGDPSKEIVRFRAHPSLSFPPSQIYQIVANNSPEEDKIPQMIVTFMGLVGTLGVLPYPYTELLMERRRYKDTAIRDFFDIFNHRLISLFYRAWEKYRFAIAYERGKEDKFTSSLFSIVGFGTRGLQNRTSLKDKGILFYGGLIAQKPHSTTAIEAILSDFFGIQFNIEQFFGQWLKLDNESFTRLGKANCQTGINTLIGKRVWDNQSKFRIKIGPMKFSQFKSFLPIGSGYQKLIDLTRLLVGLELDFDFQLVLLANEVPSTILSTHNTEQPRLGWTSWLKTRPFTKDDSQVVMKVESQPYITKN